VCVCVQVWVSAAFYRVCVRVFVHDSLPLTYVPSFVLEDYSFPFEVRQLAQRGRSERRPRAGFHTFPTAACRLGGKYVCRPQRQREREASRAREKWKNREKGKRRRVINAESKEKENEAIHEEEKKQKRRRERGITIK